MKYYGIIGKPLEHSFSARWFTEMFHAIDEEAAYKEYALSPEQILQQSDIAGFNVTCPYKQQILPLLHEVDDVAREIGAVNTVKRLANGHWKGYNTDWIGFMVSLQHWFPTPPSRALILGTGGAAHAIAYALQQAQIDYAYVSRDPKKGISYAEISHWSSSQIKRYPLIINCTPLGMLPNITDYPDIPYPMLSDHHWLYDCIYNPPQSQFLTFAKEQHAHIKNGYEMLVEQAKAAWQIWQMTE